MEESEGIIWDRKLKKQLKGKVLEACVVPAVYMGWDTGTDRDTGGDDADSIKILGPKNRQSNPRR